MNRWSVLSFCALSLLSAGNLHGISIPVEYRQISWLPEVNPTPYPIAIATSTTGHSAHQNLHSGRLPTQSFTTVDAFTLDKIWIKYHDLEPNAANHSTRILLFELANANGASIPSNPTDLFSEPQTHQFPSTTFNNRVENYAVFDVENLELEANKSYAFQFVTTGVSVDNYPYRWFSFGNDNAYAGGTFYRGDRATSDQKLGFDQVFALQFLPPPPPPEPEPELPTGPGPVVVPEPATGMLGIAAAGVLGLAGRRSRK